MVALYRRKLTELESTKSSFRSLRWSIPPLTIEEEVSEFRVQVARDVRRSWEGNLSRTNKELDIVKAEISDISGHLDHLEEEMIGWKFARDLAKHSIQHLKPSIDTLREGLDSAKESLSAKKRVPKEIWVMIFKLCLTEELEEYVGRPNPPSHISPLVISHVCRSWRSVAFENRKLWEVIPTFPKRPLSLWHCGPLQRDLASPETRLTFMLHLSTSRSLRNIPQYWDSQPSFGWRLSARKITHTLHIITHGDIYEHQLTDSCIPLKQIDTIKLNAHEIGKKSQIWSLFEGFTQIHSLEVEDRGSKLLPRLDGLGFMLPSVKYLHLKLDDMPSIDLTGRLKSDLVELRIQHNGRFAINRLPKPLRIPTLKTLGVVYPEIAFLESLDVPRLEKLELYGSETITRDPGDALLLRKVLGRIHHISFHHWKAREIPLHDGEDNFIASLVVCPAVVLKVMVAVTTALVSIKFIDCTMAGKPLLDIFKSGSEKDANLSLAHLQRIDFIGCSGVTRADFEELKDLFPNLSFCAYNSFLISPRLIRPLQPKQVPRFMSKSFETYVWLIRTDQ
ncbi:hypothetical protein CPB86DRAFT_818595 [Serendipita vermifera]|nr:hypothetical protein CPB86DRAFT_818595 [Serendipita vermifera]